MLYKTMQEAQMLAAKLMSTGGELTPEIEERLEVNAENLRQDVDFYVELMRRFELESKALDERAREYKDASKKMLERRDTIKEQLKKALVELGEKNVKGNSFSVSIARTRPKVMIDEEFLPDIYFDEKITLVPCKERVRKSLEEGQIVAGAELQENLSLRSKVIAGV